MKASVSRRKSLFQLLITYKTMTGIGLRRVSCASEMSRMRNSTLHKLHFAECCLYYICRRIKTQQTTFPDGTRIEDFYAIGRLAEAKTNENYTRRDIANKKFALRLFLISRRRRYNHFSLYRLQQSLRECAFSTLLRIPSFFVGNESISFPFRVEASQSYCAVVGI